MSPTDGPSPEPKEALELAERMNRAATRRTLAPRWFSLGVSLIIAAGFSLYAVEGVGNYPTLLMALAMVLFIWLGREKTGVFGKELPEPKSSLWVLSLITAFLLALLFGGAFIRRTYGLVWVPVVAGLIAGITVFALSEYERRHQLVQGESDRNQ